MIHENITTLTGIQSKHSFNKSNGPESNEQEREEGKEEEVKKPEHSYVFISPTFEISRD